MRSGLGRLFAGCVVVVAVLAAALLIPRGGRQPVVAMQDPQSLARDHVTAGKNLLAQQRLPEAYASFQEAVRLAPDLADAHRGLAAVTYDQGALIEAVRHLEQVAALDPADGRPYRMIGHICADLDKREEAVTAYRQALDRSLTGAARSEVHVELAEQLLKLGDAAAALALLPQPSDTAADSPQALAVRAEATWTTGKADEAVTLVEAGLERFADEPRLLSLLGRLRIDLGGYGDAVAPLEAAARLDRAELTTLQALATAYERLGRSEDAARVREQRSAVQQTLERMTSLTVAADAEPWNGDLRDELAVLCESIGRQDLATMWRHAAAVCRERPPQRVKR
jgi:Flp pilus assembly protein TadD